MSAGLPHEAIAEWWGDLPDATTIARMASAPLDQWALFAESYQNRPARTFSSRPGRNTVYCQLGSKADDLYDEAMLPLGTVRITALALLAHTVVVPDPIDALTRKFLNLSNWDEPPSEGERLRTLRLVADLRPLAAHGALVYTSGLPGSFDPRTVEAVRDLTAVWGQIPDDELDWRWLTDPRGIRGSASGALAALEILLQLGWARSAAPDSSIFIGTPLEHSALRYLYRLTGEMTPQRFGELSTYAALPIPILVPEPSAVMSIRDADEYASLRNDLEHALAQVEGISAESEGWLDQARQVMHEELALSRRVLESSLSKVTPLARIKRTMSAVSFSALGAAAATTAGGKPAPSVVAGAVTGIGSLLASSLSERRQVREDKAVLESYLMFGEAAESW